MIRSIRQLIAISFLSILPLALASQEQLSIRGSLQANVNWFIEDSVIGATGIPQYDDNAIGGEVWLDLNAAYKGWKAGLRLDGFEKSNLLNPNGSYSNKGLGKFYLSKSIDNLDLTLGYIYDQIGSGIIFRSYEQRPLLIDNALIGGMASYAINDAISVKGYYGRQKNLFDVYPNTVRGISAEGYFSFGSSQSLSISPGIGYINRMLSDETMDGIVNVLKTYTEADRVLPKYHVYLGTLYNTLTYKNFIWHTEFAIKSSELYFDPNAIRTEITGTRVFGKYVRNPGTVWYTSLSATGKGLGVTLEAKRTSNFNFRIDPLLRLNFGLISFIPPMNRQHTYRLLSRYNPATQDLSELALQIDIKHAISPNLKWHVNISDIRTLDEELLYREFYMSWQYRKPRKWEITGGIQIMEYNQSVFEVKPGVDNVQAVTPFFELDYRFTSKKSLRAEMQYMSTAQDYGKWIFGLLEWSMASHWQFELSAMYNIDPGESSPDDVLTGLKKKILYPTAGVTYTLGNKRWALRYVKQVEGVVCTGGICRLEPAFSGLRFNTYVAF